MHGNEKVRPWREIYGIRERFSSEFMAGFDDRNVNLRVVDPPESKIEIPHQNIKIALMAAYKMRKQMHGNQLKMQE